MLEKFHVAKAKLDGVERNTGQGRLGEINIITQSMVAITTLWDASVKLLLVILMSAEFSPSSFMSWGRVYARTQSAFYLQRIARS